MSKIKIYRASAGSGKTYILTLEYIKCLLLSGNNNYFKYILAVSFTKDATNEMKKRILAELYGLAMNTNDSKKIYSSLQKLLKEEKVFLNKKSILVKSRKIFQAILHNYSYLNITTIDSFFQKIVHNLSRELGCSDYFELEMNAQRVVQEAVYKVIEKASENNELFEWIKKYVEYLINEGKNWEIEKPIKIFSECIYDEFFQESKKYFLNDPFFYKKILENQKQIQKKCQFFFKKTKQKIDILLENYCLSEDDFIKTRGNNPIHFFQKLSDGMWKSCLKKIRIIEKYCNDNNAWATKNHERKKDIIILVDSKLASMLRNTLKVLHKISTAQIIIDNLYQLGLIRSVIKEIEKENHRQNRFVLSDTNAFLHQMIDDNDAPFIYEKIGTKIKHVMVDEFQDISRLQWKNLRILFKEIVAKNDFGLIVGDEKQAIYRWRNSHWGILKKISKELNGNEKSLLYNWRSEKNIVNFNNMFFISIAKMLNHNNLSIYDIDKVKQKAIKNDEKGYVFVKFIKEKSLVEEGNYLKQMQESVFEQLRILYDSGVLAKDICILLRKNETINIFAEYLSQKMSDYPKMAENHYLTIISNEAFYLSNSLAIKIIITSIKLINEQDNKIYKDQLTYLLKLGELNCCALDTDLLSSMPLFELVGYICKLFELERLVGQSAYLFVFYDYLNQYLIEYPATIHHFLDYWEQEGRNKTIPARTRLKGIRAMTIHKSKGLQFSTVIVPYCDWDLNPKNNTLIWCKSPKNIKNIPLFPIQYKKEMKNTDFALEYEKETIQSHIDNLNLLYVAFTRAEQNLIVLAKYNKVIKKIKKVSDLLQLFAIQINKYWEEESFCLKIGKLSFSNEKINKMIIDNPLKKDLLVKEITFSLKTHDKINFKQSSQSKNFTKDIDDDYKQKVININYGNVMHYLFSQINCMNDIEKIVNDGVIQGLIQVEEKVKYASEIRQFIKSSGVENWFNNQNEVYKECTIIAQKDGTIINKRPDRVLIADNKVVIIDYKFGESHFVHKKQLQYYVSLLTQMNYSNIEAYLWYVVKNQVKKI